MGYHTPDWALLRGKGTFETRSRLSIAPRDLTLMWSGEINEPVTVPTGARTVNVDQGQMHGPYVFADLVAGLPVYITTAYGVYRVRFKSVTGDEHGARIYIAQNNIPWADNQPFEVHHDFPLFPIRSRIGADGTFYKDYDVTYTDQNDEPPPVAVIGPDWATFLNPGQSAVAVLDASASYAMADGATIVAWAWSVCPDLGGETIADPTAEVTTITHQNGWPFWVQLTVTDSNGKTGTTRARHFVHSGDYPYIPVERASFGVDWESGEAQYNFTVKGVEATGTNIPNGGRFLLWTEDYIDGVLSYQGGWTGRQMGKLAGYVCRDTVRRVPGSSEVEFEGENALGLLARMRNYSVALAYKANPSKWYEYGNGGITTAQALHHLWKWHSTLFEVHPVILPIANTVRRYAFDDVWEKASLLAQAQSLVQGHGIFGAVSCNEQGVIHVETDAQMYPADYAVAEDLTDGDWRDEMTIVEAAGGGEACFANLSGFAFAGGTPTPIISKSGEVAEDVGDGEIDLESLMFTDQAQANTLTGRAMAKENNQYPEASHELIPGLAHSLAIPVAPQAWYRVTLDPSDTARGFDWSSGKNLVVRRIDGEYTPGKCRRTVTYEPYAVGPTGVTGDYPTNPPDEDTDVPDVPIPPEPPLPPEPDIPPRVAVTFDDVNGCWWTVDSGLSWTARNGGLASTVLLDGMVQRGWSMLQADSNPEKAILVACGAGFIALTVDAGRTWTAITPVDNPPNDGGDSPAPTAATITYTAVECPNAVTRTVYAIAEWQNNAAEWRGWLLKTEDFGVTWSWVGMAFTSGGGGCIQGDVARPVNAFWSPNVETLAAPNPYQPNHDVRNYNEGTEGAILACEVISPWTMHMYTEFDGATHGAPNDRGFMLLIDFGCTLVADVNEWLQLWVSSGNDAFCLANFGHVYVTNDPDEFETAKTWTTYPHAMTGWTHRPGINVSSWFQHMSAYPTQMRCISDAVAYYNEHPFRYLALVSDANDSRGEYTAAEDGVLTVADFEIRNVGSASCPDLTFTHRPLGLAVDFDTGENVYVTAWEDDGNGTTSLVLMRYDTDLVLQDTTVVQSGVSQAQMEAGTHVIWPRVVYQPGVAGWGDKVYVFGSLNGTNGYIGESLDAGATITDRSGGIGCALVTSLVAPGDGSGGVLYFYALGGGKVFKENGAWVWDAGNAVTFNPSWHGSSIGYDTALTGMFGNRVTGANKVAVDASPYTSWVDRTDSHPATGGIRSLSWVTP